MKAPKLILAVIVVVCLLLVACARRTRAKALRREKLGSLLRRLWFDHVDYTSLFINASFCGGDSGGGAKAFASRLQANQDQIAAAVGKFYGSAAQRELARLLHEHITIAAKIVAAVKEGRPKDSLAAEWRRNSDEVARLLCEANARWECSGLEEMMAAHLSATSDFLDARARQQWAKLPALHDAVVDQAMHMANVLASGIYADKIEGGGLIRPLW